MSDTARRDDKFIGSSEPVQAMLAHISAVAPLDRPMLILGERGTGKELVAQRLAFLSERWNRPFVTVDCGALSDTLLDSELFGHEAGAFTGAARRRAGRFELADGGTVFLDEIGNAASAVQEKLLRLIEYGTFQRVGGNETVKVDVRVVAATNADLPAAARRGGFRADLLDRLAFDVIAVPPLRARGDDVLVLARHFATRMTAELRRDVFAGFSPEAEAALRAHDWPGNVRELRNAVERSLCRMADPRKTLRALVIDPFPPGPAAQAAPAPAAATAIATTATTPRPHPAAGFAEAVAAFEKALLADALLAARHNQTQAARALGLGYHQFRGVLRRHGMLPAATARGG